MDIYKQRKKNSKTIAEKYDATVNNYILITILWKTLLIDQLLLTLYIETLIKGK